MKGVHENRKSITPVGNSLIQVSWSLMLMDAGYNDILDACRGIFKIEGCDLVSMYLNFPLELKTTI